MILAHYYQKPEIQDLADFVGDSLDLSRKAAATDAEVIAFCGVRFMAETAKILSPEKTVILPDMDAGCSLEDSCPPDQFAAFRAAHPDHIALTYINCSAAVKALSDIIVTSSSAQIILDQIPTDQKIIFGPDRHLGGYLARKTGRDMLLWPGICIVHQAFSETELLKLKAEHPGAPVAAHPECPPHIIEHADHVGSTRSILEFALTSPATTILVATEPHIIHQMEKAAPGKTFIGVPGGDGNCNCNMCPYMALNTLEKLYVALRDLQPRIELPPEVMTRARVPLERMLEMAGRTVGQGDVGTRAEEGPIIEDRDGGVPPEDIDPAISGDIERPRAARDLEIQQDKGDEPDHRSDRDEEDLRRRRAGGKRPGIGDDDARPRLRPLVRMAGERRRQAQRHHREEAGGDDHQRRRSVGREAEQEEPEQHAPGRKERSPDPARYVAEQVGVVKPRRMRQLVGVFEDFGVEAHGNLHMLGPASFMWVWRFNQANE